MLWRAESRLLHLNVLWSSFTVQSFIRFLWMAGRSPLETPDVARLETLNVATSEQDTVQAPACLVLFVFCNRSLQRLDIQGSRFFSRGRGKLAPGLVIARAISSHPLSRAMLLAPSNFNTTTQGPTEWTYLLSHMLICTLLGGEEGHRSIP